MMKKYIFINIYSVITQFYKKKRKLKISIDFLTDLTGEIKAIKIINFTFNNLKKYRRLYKI